MTQAEENEIRTLVREELIGIIQDAQSQVGLTKDPTGMGRKILEGMVNLIRKRSEPAEGLTGRGNEE